jgi:hypothetical protein
MDWQTLCDGLKTWFARESGLPVTSVCWAGEDGGYRDFPTADLQLTSHAAQHGDELRWIDAGPDVNLGVAVLGNRKRVLSCRVISRDQRPGNTAYAILERVRDRIQLPINDDSFHDLNIGLQGIATLVDISHQWDRRTESEAVLDISFNFAVDEEFTDSGVGFIEHVEVGGTVHDGSTSITVPAETTPPIP